MFWAGGWGVKKKRKKKWVRVRKIHMYALKMAGI